MVIFLWSTYIMTPKTLFLHTQRLSMDDKRMQNAKSAHPITPEGTKPRKMTFEVIKGH